MLESAGGSDVSARVKLTAHLDDEHSLRLTATDRSVRNGLSRNGVSVAFRRRGAFEAAYDVEGDGPSFRFLSQADVLDRTVDLKYTHELRGKRTNTLEAGFDVDDKTRLHLKYDLTGGFDRPDLKSLSVRARYQHNDDWAVEPQYALGAESFSCAVEHRLDADNHVRAHYDQGANTGSLEWTTSAVLGDGGNLKIKASSDLNEDALKRMPTLTVEKHWSTDV